MIQEYCLKMKNLMVDLKMCQVQTSAFQIDTRYQVYYLDGHVMLAQITDSIFWMIWLLGIASIAIDK